MSAASDAIRKFHEAFDVPTETKVTKLAMGRRKLHIEEADEVEEALSAIGCCGCSECHADLRGKLEDLAEELADVMVIAYGTADVLGIDLDRAFAIKMAANMAKLPECDRCAGSGDDPNAAPDAATTRLCAACNGTGKGPPIKREGDQKILKPPGWQKPSMAEAIK